MSQKVERTEAAENPGVAARLIREKEPWKKGYENSDVMLHPDLSGYKPVSFAQGNAMFEIGYNCAMERMAEIKEKILAAKRRKGIKIK